jgi:iron-sulfur cluster assembly protein
VLTISPTASEAIRGLVTSSELPEGAGVRIATGPSELPGTSLELSLVTQPRETDEVVEETGATVYVEPDLAPLLEDKELDAKVEGDSVAFRVVDRDGPTGDPTLNGST